MNFWGPEGYYQLGRDLCEGIEWEDVYARFKIATGVTNKSDLANCLEARGSWLNYCRRYQIVTVVWLRRLVFLKNEYTPQWVLRGTGKPKREGWELDSPRGQRLQ